MIQTVVDHSAPANPAPPPAKHGRRLKAVRLLPSLATLGNLLSGMLAIVCCLLAMSNVTLQVGGEPWSFVTIGAWLVVLGLLLDGIDGQLARLTKGAGVFGANLDSLADMVSFGLAPAMLLITICVRETGPVRSISLADQSAVLSGMIFTACAALRLARFQAEHGDVLPHARFKGLPSPAAALALIAIVVLHEQLIPVSVGTESPAGHRALLLAGSVVAVALGVLMVSRLSYPHLFNLYVRRRRPVAHLVLLLLLAALIWLWPAWLLLLLSHAYVLSGPLVRFLRRTPS